MIAPAAVPGPVPGTAPPLVLGLDLSLTATGVALPDGSTHTIRTRQRDGDLRLSHIRHDLTDMIRCALPHLAVLEDLPTHAHSAGITGMVHGVVRCLLAELRIPAALIVPATLKAYATGRGNCDKAAMAAAARAAGVVFEGDAGGDQCDAWWLRAAGLDRLGHPVVALPAAQRARLDKARWPDRTAVAA